MSEPKKLLIITYYWPPAGGPGVQRWLKFVKYLQKFDIANMKIAQKANQDDFIEQSEVDHNVQQLIYVNQNN